VDLHQSISDFNLGSDEAIADTEWDELLKQILVEWSVTCTEPHSAVGALFKVLKPYPSLPLNARTLLKIPTNYSVKAKYRNWKKLTTFDW
jgi:hypothetical protein